MASSGGAAGIWLCADDYGIAPGVSAAIRDLVARGRLNATSAMVFALHFSRAEADALAALNAERRRVAIGLHVTLTAPFGPQDGGFRPLRHGAFVPVGELLRLALLRRLSPAALQDEIAAQFRAFAAAFGGPPDFIDGHQHVHLFPQIGDAVLSAAQTFAPRAWVRQCGQPGFAPSRLRDPKGLLIDTLSRAFRRRAKRRGVRVNPAFAGTYSFSPGADFAALFPGFLHGLPDGGLVMCHPGFVDAELRRLDPLTDLREREHAYLAGDAFPAALAAAGMNLVDPADDQPLPSG